jgi:hypothetical protein
MLEIRGGRRLALKAAQHLFFACQAWREHLERHVSLEVRVERLIDSSHSPAPDLALDLIFAQTPTDEFHHHSTTFCGN